MAENRRKAIAAPLVIDGILAILYNTETLLATVFANHVGFSFSSSLCPPLTDQIHIMDYEQVFAIGVVSLAIGTSEAARGKHPLGSHKA